MAMMERAMSLFVPFGRREETPAEVDTLKAEVESLRRELANLKNPKAGA
jgi:polyhydroxyalkanoate synthesis regulator phasin